jgi:DNA-binding NarL/FixJ family response regulator
MPVMNGFDAARELRRLSPAWPLVMFTNFSMPQFINEALLPGVRTVVSKSELAGLVHELHTLLESS